MLIFVSLDGLTQLSGILGFLSILITWMYGVLVLYKYIKTKEKVLFYFFLAIIFTMSPWYPSGLGYIYWLFTRGKIAYQVYVLLGTLGVPIALYSWLQIYMPALHKKQKGIVIWTVIGLSLIFYTYLAYSLFFTSGAPVETLVGIKRSAIDIDYKGFVLVFLGLSLLISTITGNEFSLVSLRAKDNPIMKWKGRFLILSFNLYTIGAIGDGFIPLTSATLIIFRTFMILSSTFYYIGFILPKWAKRLLSLD